MNRDLLVKTSVIFRSTTFAEANELWEVHSDEKTETHGVMAIKTTSQWHGQQKVPVKTGKWVAKGFQNIADATFLAHCHNQLLPEIVRHLTEKPKTAFEKVVEDLELHTD